MRKVALFMTVLGFVGTDIAMAAPAPLAAAGKAVIANSMDDLTLVRTKKKRARKASAAAATTTTTTGPAGAAAGATTSSPASGVANPSVTPSGQNPAVDQGLRTKAGAK